MSKGLPRSRARGNPLLNPIMKQTLRVKNLTFLVDGASGVGWGTAVLGDFPAGNVMLLGAVGYLQFTTAAAGVTATFDGDFAIGTTPTADATVTGTDANIVPLTALGAATAKVSPRVRGVQADGAFAGVVFDNTDGSLELNLNLIIDDAAISADDCSFVANGELHIAFIMLGDD